MTLFLLLKNRYAKVENYTITSIPDYDIYFYFIFLKSLFILKIGSYRIMAFDVIKNVCKLFDDHTLNNLIISN